MPASDTILAGSIRPLICNKRMTQQDSLMVYDPVDLTPNPYPSHAAQWRKRSSLTWFYNPWTGTPRKPEDIVRDPQGVLIIPPWEPIYAKPNSV
jgi:hypothetical protein